MNADSIKAFATTVLGFFGGLFVSKGYFDNATMATLVGSIAAIIGVGFDFIFNRKS
jgi:mannitol-specific phosphotransferase system IIBC component